SGSSGRIDRRGIVELSWPENRTVRGRSTTGDATFNEGKMPAVVAAWITRHRCALAPAQIAGWGKQPRLGGAPARIDTPSWPNDQTRKRPAVRLVSLNSDRAEHLERGVGLEHQPLRGAADHGGRSPELRDRAAVEFEYSDDVDLGDEPGRGLERIAAGGAEVGQRGDQDVGLGPGGEHRRGVLLEPLHPRLELSLGHRIGQKLIRPLPGDLQRGRPAVDARVGLGLDARLALGFDLWRLDLAVATARALDRGVGHRLAAGRGIRLTAGLAGLVGAA